MKMPTLFLLLIFLLTAVFTILNWEVFIAPSELNLIFAKIQLPFGLVMLGLLVIITVSFLAFVAYLQGSVLLEARRHSRELKANRELADKAEASRFTELRAFLDQELVKYALQIDNDKAVVIAKLDKLEEEIKASLDQTSNTFGAYIGELEDRLDKNQTPKIL